MIKKGHCVSRQCRSSSIISSGDQACKNTRYEDMFGGLFWFFSPTWDAELTLEASFMNIHIHLWLEICNNTHGRFHTAASSKQNKPMKFKITPTISRWRQCTLDCSSKRANLMTLYKHDHSLPLRHHPNPDSQLPQPGTAQVKSVSQ